MSLIYNDNKPMINEISKYTWTLDNRNHKKSNFVKSDADEKALSEIIQRYDLNKKDSLRVKELSEYFIDVGMYEYKRREFKKVYKREI